MSEQKQGNLRQQIQALKNQAKARGHNTSSITDLSKLKELSNTRNTDIINKYDYVYRDVFKSFIYITIAIFILFVISLKVSDISFFSIIRHSLKISYYQL